jgi:hypothetical protein
MHLGVIESGQSRTIHGSSGGTVDPGEGEAVAVLHEGKPLGDRHVLLRLAMGARP